MASAMQLKELISRFDVVSNPHELKTIQFLGEYARQTDHIWEHYVKHKNLFYHAEMRWSDSPFWKRRHCASGELSIGLGGAVPNPD